MSSSEKSRPSWFWPLAAIVIPAVGLMARIRIAGAEKMPRDGAYILAPNHVSELDPLMVAVAVWRMGRAPRFMAKDSLFRVPVLGAALRATGMVPVARTSSRDGAAQTMAQATALVKDGRGVIVYPEGTLTRDPHLWPMRGKSGAARLALAGDLPLIPVAHWGVQDIMGRYAKGLSLWPPRKLVRMAVGDPVDLSDLKDRPTDPSAIAEATSRLMAAITALLEGIRGEKAPDERWDPSSHGQSETGRL
ncbi:1-acyl-sn-glycerol-3-phosphate acyltransferase [Microbacterium sp. MEC084]|uniref:lysophospholipid acyltransferase family protein n=1 Tax=Microbacterium sp. MEC084 TaxID=1963027 RepID=UPI00106F747A|nr:lysophospholipid acyltransferase family protein [Microbacterium sp. MEC084]MCD1269182.1 1-acyl-sn-glycerol-3-phosphate acyltransferase [Microbacterium sp. MEC084]